MENETPNEAGTPKEGDLDEAKKKARLEKVFNVLKSKGKNTAEGLVSLLRDKKIIDARTEAIARKVISGAADMTNIDFEKFSEVCSSVADSKGVDVKNISKSITRTSDAGTSHEDDSDYDYDETDESYESDDEHSSDDNHSKSDVPLQ